MKKIVYIILIYLIVFIGVNEVYAGDASISSSSTTVKVGDTVTISVKTTNLGGTYKIYSSDNSVLSGGTQNDTYGSTTITAYFTAKTVGTAVVTFAPFSNNYLSDPDTDEFFNENRSITINVVANSSGQTDVNKKNTNNKKINVNKTYNSNNNLKTLDIDGYELSPKFDKDTLEYSVKLEDGCENITINAKAEESTSTIKGTGELSVSEGINTLEIIVTAENGNEKTYKIIATINEKDPINVSVDNNDYTVVKKVELLTKPDGYEEITVKISEFDIPAFYNEITKVTLIGLKDSDGNVDLFQYNSSNGKYSKYDELTFDTINLYIHPSGDNKYDSIKVKIGEEEIFAYRLNNLSEYYLLYGTNTSTGYEGYYLYDRVENSVQRYNDEILLKITQQKDKYFSLSLVLGCVCFLSMLFLLIQINIDYKEKNC